MFSCEYGFHEKTGVEPMNCTEQGTWNYDMSTLCIGKSCIVYAFFVIAVKTYFMHFSDILNIKHMNSIIPVTKRVVINFKI